MNNLKQSGAIKICGERFRSYYLSCIHIYIFHFSMKHGNFKGEIRLVFHCFMSYSTL